MKTVIDIIGPNSKDGFRASQFLIIGHLLIRNRKLEGVSIRQYNVIYKLIEDVEKAVQGLLEPEYIEVAVGQAEVKTVFEAGKRGRIAGSQVKEGKATRDSQARVIRAGKVIAESRVSGLRRFKDDVREVTTGMECGVKLENFNDFQVGDMLQFFRMERVA